MPHVSHLYIKITRNNKKENIATVLHNQAQSKEIYCHITYASVRGVTVPISMENINLE